jgi:hypothetical protein
MNFERVAVDDGRLAVRFWATAVVVSIDVKAVRTIEPFRLQ